jgi:hypothetical protein
VSYLSALLILSLEMVENMLALTPKCVHANSRLSYQFNFPFNIVKSVCVLSQCTPYTLLMHSLYILVTPYALLMHSYALLMHSVCTHYAHIMHSLCSHYILVLLMRRWTLCVHSLYTIYAAHLPSEFSLVARPKVGPIEGFVTGLSV